MRKLFKKNGHGSMGVGAMIIFIAMVLVAGIAASVFIQVANQLQMQALYTGMETIDEVATGIAIMDIEGNVTDPDNGISKMTITVRGRAGSGDIDLSELVIEIADNETKAVLAYDSNVHTATVPSNVFDASNYTQLSATEFGIIVLEDADGSCSATSPIINKGDTVMLVIDAGDVFSPGIPERMDIWGNVIPETGAWAIINFRTPATYTDFVYDLQ